MLTLIYVLYVLIGLTQYPYLERNALLSIQDFNKKPTALMHLFWYVVFMVVLIHLDPIYRFVIFASKPWIKK